MYGIISTYNYHENQPNVGKSSSRMVWVDVPGTAPAYYHQVELAIRKSPEPTPASQRNHQGLYKVGPNQLYMELQPL